MPDDPGQSGTAAGRQQNPQHGNSRSYILRRLEAAGLHDVAEAVRSGRVSAFAAAVELGWTARPENIGSGSRNQARRRRHRFEALAEDGQKNSRLMELWLGPNPTQGSLFNSREELQTAWETHRAELMARWGSHGRRPAAFYEFEFDGVRPSYATERSTLWRIGLLSEAERTEVEAEWEVAFAEARGMAAQERREHFAHHDVPDELIREWTAARKRPRRQAAASEEAAAPK